MATENRLIDANLANADGCIEKQKIKTHFAKIIVGGTLEKPCYDIMYFDPTDKKYHIGFGSYFLGYVFKWLSEEFEIIDDCPTVDAVEVVHGHWEKTIDNCTVMHKCSVCGARVVKGFYEYENPNRYCYHCGAKMDGDKDSYGYNADKCDTVTYKGVKLPMPPKMDGERKYND